MSEALQKTRLEYAPISGRIVMAPFGKDETVALETRDAMPEFFRAALNYAFDGEMPEPGKGVAIDFGNGSEQFVMTIKRKDDADV